MVAMTRTQRVIYEAVKERPRTADQLRDHVWGDDPNGGPDCRHTIYVHMRNLNQRIAAIGEKISAEYPGGVYRLNRDAVAPAWKFDPCGLYPG